MSKCDSSFSAQKFHLCTVAALSVSSIMNVLSFWAILGDIL